MAVVASSLKARRMFSAHPTPMAARLRDILRGQNLMPCGYFPSAFEFGGNGWLRGDNENSTVTT